MTTRRNFFKVLGLGAGVAATGVAGAAALVAATPGKSEVVKQLEKVDNNSITFTAAYGEEIPRPPSNTFYVHATRSHNSVKATIKVGPDGNMYLKQNGKWARIVTE